MEKSPLAQIEMSLSTVLDGEHLHIVDQSDSLLVLPGEVGHSDADAATKEKAREAAVAALAEPLEVFHKFYMDGKPFIGGVKPSIADMRLAATLEFLAVIPTAKEA